MRPGSTFKNIQLVVSAGAPGKPGGGGTGFKADGPAESVGDTESVARAGAAEVGHHGDQLGSFQIELRKTLDGDGRVLKCECNASCPFEVVEGWPPSTGKTDWSWHSYDQVFLDSHSALLPSMEF